jgi:D-xylose transport system substrate-binding protein
VPSPSPSLSRATTGPGGCTKVGVLLPNTSDPRWQHQDGPLLTSMITQQVPGVKVAVDNADGSAATQLSQATTDLSAGDCILVVAPVDPASAAAIVTQAMAKKVPVIAYDQLIQSKDTSYVVAFDQVKVGELQGQYIADHFRNYVAGSAGKTALINGDTSAGSVERHQGVTGVLQPLFDNGSLQKLFDQFTPGDSPATAGNEMEGVLTLTQDHIQIVYAADDGLADAAIQALATAHLNGKVLVTGAGATVTGLRHILTGDQAMTVEMNPSLEAQGTARLIGALARGTSTAALASGSLRITDGSPVPAVLETPVAVDKTNINQTVIADGSVTVAQLCTGLPAGTATNGICP